MGGRKGRDLHWVMVSPLVSSLLLSRPSSPLFLSLPLRPSVREKRVGNEGGGSTIERSERCKLTTSPTTRDRGPGLGFPFSGGAGAS